MCEKSAEAALSAVTHDLRQPLQAVLLYLDALDRRTEREDARAILGKARLAANALSEQLNALSLYSRLKRNELKPFVETVSMRDVGESAARDGVALVLSEPERQLETDPNLLSQALRALAENVLRHGGGSGALEITTEGGDTLFVVRDNGKGVPQADRTRAFAPFVKLEAGGEGLGLGLSNAQALANVLGGVIIVYDNPGGGAVFTLRLPASAR
jgi:signal transduction histidine kinase